MHARPLLCLLLLLTAIFVAAACFCFLRPSVREELAAAARPYFEGFSEADYAARGLDAASGPRGALQAYLGQVLDEGSEPPAHAARAAELRDELAQLLAASGWARARPLLRRTRVAFMRDAAENGYPHTHGAVICLPTAFFAQPRSAQLETFAHEFVHVYQRAHPGDTAGLLQAWGYSRWAPRAEAARALQQHARSNPDLDAWVWQRGGAAGLMAFPHSRPLRLADARLVCAAGDCASYAGGLPASALQVEHPYEVMACVLARLLVAMGDHIPQTKKSTSGAFGGPHGGPEGPLERAARAWMHAR